MAKILIGKTILNTTRSSSERWTHFAETDELVNGKMRYKVADFAASDHPQRDVVIGWMTEKNIPVSAGGVPVPTVEIGEVPSSEIVRKIVDQVRELIHSQPPGIQRTTLVAMVYGDANEKYGKGITRKARKGVRELIGSGLASLPAL